MLDLVQLRMHLHDEYAVKTNLQDHLRRKRHLASTAGTPEPVPSTPIDIKSDGNSFLNPSESTFNVLNVDIPIASADQVDPLVPALDENLDEAMGSSSFKSITQTLQERSQLDDVGGTSHDFTPPFEKICLNELFNFANSTWTEIISKTAMKSLDEELELYELVEMDAEGEDDGDILNDAMLSHS